MLYAAFNVKVRKLPNKDEFDNLPENTSLFM